MAYVLNAVVKGECDVEAEHVVVVYVNVDSEAGYF
jgi:hypothetical protein